MNKTVVIIMVVVAVVVLGVGAYFLFSPKNNPTDNLNSGGQLGTLPSVNLPASSTVANTPTSTYLSIGTAKGTVQVNNFYLSNPPTDDGGSVDIKQLQNYVISYDPADSSFWLGISGMPLATWQSAAEQDFLLTMGINKIDACKLNVTIGVIYSPTNPDDGKSFPLSFCDSGAFQAQ